MEEKIEQEIPSPDEVKSELSQDSEMALKIDTVFDKNGISIIDLITQEDETKIIMLVKTSIFPEEDPVKITMNFDTDGAPSTLDFEGADVYTEEQGKKILNDVMKSLITLLEGLKPGQFEKEAEEEVKEEVQEEKNEGPDTSKEED